MLKFLPARRWRVLVADREFLGTDWFSFLRRRKIKRCIRSRLDTRVDDLRVDGAYKHVKTGKVVGLLDKACVYGNVMQVVVTRAKTGELVALATDLKIWETRSVYKLRWSVECTEANRDGLIVQRSAGAAPGAFRKRTFSSLKSRGFGLEESAMTKADRLERLFGLVTLAFACCLRIGVWRNSQIPIPIKKHGRRAVSIVRYGWEVLVIALRWASPVCQTYLALLNHPSPAPGAASPQDVRY